MFPNSESAQLAPYFEAQKRKAGHQKRERGIVGAGYWYGGYPYYIGAMALGGALTQVTPPDNDQAQPDMDSKVTNAAAEVTGPDSNAGMAANTAPAGA